MHDQPNQLKTGIVFGATGLIGGQVTRQLLEHPAYNKVLIFVRRPSGITHEKLAEYIIDFSKPCEYGTLMQGDHVYSCFGTNIMKTRDKKMWRISDVDNVIQTADICHKNGALGFAVVSSIGANPKGGNSYLGLKGEMEEGVRTIGFAKLAILRPSFLLGKRKDFRPHELIARGLMLFFGLLMWGPAKEYKAIHARTVARAMIRILNEDFNGRQVFSSGELQRIGRAKNKT
jgi:uncharacterized protein YbjT (DUF2867 family)